MIAIVDYGAGNLRSIQRAIEATGAPVTITADPAVIVAAEAVVLPGVGNAGAAMKRLRDMDVIPAIEQSVAAKKPFLGICLGMQLLFDYQEEGSTEGLGLIPGQVRALTGSVKVPHIGWNLSRIVRSTPLGTTGDAYRYYFVHSYTVLPDDPTAVVATVYYGQEFPSIVARDNIWGTQFHPEKSSNDGLALIRSFVALTQVVPETVPA